MLRSCAKALALLALLSSASAHADTIRIQITAHVPVTCANQPSGAIVCNNGQTIPPPTVTANATTATMQGQTVQVVTYAP